MNILNSPSQAIEQAVHTIPLSESIDRPVLPSPNASNDRSGDESWLYTQQAKDLMGDMHKGRKMIERDSSIGGRVSYGTYGGEAIVVDPAKYPEIYAQSYDAAYLAATEKSGVVSQESILKSVFYTVSASMDYSLPAVEDIFQELGGGKDGTKIELSVYIREGKGVCRHMGLYCGALLKMFQDNGLLEGSVSFDRNIANDPDKSGGHAWARYTDPDEQVYILDVAQDYFGKLEDSTGAERWDYFRPDEKKKMERAEYLGSLGMVRTDRIKQDDPVLCSASKQGTGVVQQLVGVLPTVDGEMTISRVSMSSSEASDRHDGSIGGNYISIALRDLGAKAERSTLLSLSTLRAKSTFVVPGTSRMYAVDESEEGLSISLVSQNGQEIKQQIYVEAPLEPLKTITQEKVALRGLKRFLKKDKHLTEQVEPAPIANPLVNEFGNLKWSAKTATIIEASKTARNFKK